MIGMETSLRSRRAAGHKLLVPYVTGGLDGWQDAIRAAAANGADAIEIGIPFSDPVMDGPVIQEASQRALDAGATPAAILDAAAELDVQIPLAVMTYANIVYRAGFQRFAERLAAAGISAALLPDVPLEETAPWAAAADAAGVETVMFAAPTAPDDRSWRSPGRTRGPTIRSVVTSLEGLPPFFSGKSVALRREPWTIGPVRPGQRDQGLECPGAFA
mgnify:CR=1 FL=1